MKRTAWMTAVGAAAWTVNPVGPVVAWAAPQAAAEQSAKDQSAKNQAAKDQAAKAEEPAALDLIIFKNGRTIEGTVLKETGTAVTVRFVTSIGSPIEQTYEKSEILKVERGGGSKKAEAPAPDAMKKDGAPADAKAKPPVNGAASESANEVYLVELTGEFGRDVSYTPLRQIMTDAKKHQPDVLVFKVDCDYSFLGQEREDWDPSSANDAFNQLETARQLAVLLTDELRDDPEWKTKPRLVFWVDKALGGVAFLPFISPDVFFTSEGRHGGIGYLEFIFDSVGDEVAQEKQYSLRVARAEGMAIHGGHDPKIVRAMARADYVLSVTFAGGEPVYSEDESGEILLTDDADDNAGRRDTIQDVPRFKGNDVLTLDADLAYRLGVSKGTADTMTDLAMELGIARDYTVVENRSERVLKEWSKAVDEAERNFRRFWRDFEAVEVQEPGQYRQRTQFRGTRIRILEDINALLERYKEAINPRAIQDAPENWETQINLMIEQIKLEQRLDRPE